MSNNICNICGSNYIYKDGKWKCLSCGAYKEEEITNEEETLLYTAAQQLRFAFPNFEYAEVLYSDIIKKYPKSSRGYWGLVRSRYGIKYEEDYDGRKIPSCYKESYQSILNDKDYKKALEYASNDNKTYYEEQAKIIEKVKDEWQKKASKLKPYDIFLCYKDTDKTNKVERTDDSYEVASLYLRLKELGYNVFYSRETLRDKAGEKYEPYIFHALETSQVMIVYSSKAEYITSTWMQNEWTRYQVRINDGKKQSNSLIIAYDGFNPSELPKALSKVQGIDAKSKKFYIDLEQIISKIISQSRKPKATIDRVEIKGGISKKKEYTGTQLETIELGTGVQKKVTNTITSEVETREIGKYSVPTLTGDEAKYANNAYRFIKNGLYDDAKLWIDNIFKTNKFSSKGFLYLFYYELKIDTLDKLIDKITNYTNYELLHNVIDYNDKETSETVLKAFIQLTKKYFDNKEHDKCYDLLKELLPYKYNQINDLKKDICNNLDKIVKDDVTAIERIFDLIIKSYTNDEVNDYITTLSIFTNICITNSLFDLADKYNKMITIVEEANKDILYNELFIKTKSSSMDELIDNIDDYFNDNIINDINIISIELLLQKMSKEEADKSLIFLSDIEYGLITIESELIIPLFKLISKYKFSERKNFIDECISQVDTIADIKVRDELFTLLLSCIDNNFIDKHISLRLDYANEARLDGYFELANKYYNEIITIDESSPKAYMGLLYSSINSPSDDIKDYIINYNEEKAGELLRTLLKHCDTDDAQVKYLNILINAIYDKQNVNLKEKDINKLNDILYSIIKYYPTSKNKDLITILYKFANNAKDKGLFDISEKHYAAIVSIDTSMHSAYWGLLQVKLKCKNDEELIKQNEIISSMPEFNNALIASSDNDKVIDKYISIKKKQLDRIEKDKKTKEKKEKRRKKTSKILKITIPTLIITILIVSFIIFYFSENKLKYTYLNSTDSYSVKPGLFYKELNVVIPSTYENKRVTALDKDAFNKANYLESLDITYITDLYESSISNCSNLTNVVFGNDLKYIDENNFCNCPLLKDIVLPNSEKEGYTFLGWKKDNDKNIIKDVVINTNTNENKSYIASFEANIYTITYDVNGGDPLINNTQEVIYDHEYELAIPIKKGTYFNGWYYENTKVSTSKWNIANDVTLVAKWVEPYEENGISYIDYGSYPQSVVLDNTLISKLNAITTTNSNGYYEYNGKEYAKVIADPDEDNYKFSDNKTTIVKGTTYYFLVEPIKWRVLSNTLDEYFLLSEYILDKHEFYLNSIDTRIIDRKTVYPNNYEYSTIREWLNNDFYNKIFSNKEKELIKETLVDNSANTTDSYTNEYACNNTRDKVFLLSYQDMKNTSYGFDFTYKGSITRESKLTDYARAIGCYMSTYSSYYENGRYWLRTPNSDYDDYAYSIYNDGHIFYRGDVDISNNGVLVAFKIQK